MSQLQFDSFPVSSLQVNEPARPPNSRLVELRNLWHNIELKMQECSEPLNIANEEFELIRLRREHLKAQLDIANQEIDEAIRIRHELMKPIGELVKARADVMQAIRDLNDGSIHVEGWENE